MKKILMYFRINIFYLFQNSIRATLTIVGICIGLVIFIIGNTFVEGYVSTYYEKARLFDKNSFIVQTESIEQLEQFSMELTKDRRKSFYILRDAGQANRNYIYKGFEIQNTVTLVGVSNNIDGKAIVFLDNNGLGAAKSAILYGRDINAGDIGSHNPVAVIEKSAAILIFQKENAVGEVIAYYDENGLIELEVIGVIADLPGIRNQIFMFNKSLNIGNEQMLFMEFYCYVPYTLLLSNPVAIQEVFLYDVPDSRLEDADLFVNYYMYSLAGSGKPRRIDSRNMLLQAAREEESAAKTTVSLFILLIVFISGFVIMTIWIFSIKERVSEIGIRRAVGASAFDIIVQFVSEGIILSVISALVSIFISIHICNIISALLARNFINLSLVVGLRTICGTISIALAQGILYTLVPAIIASKVQPTEAIRFD
jgi:putative ABC transport system permease protein